MFDQATAQIRKYDNHYYIIFNLVKRRLLIFFRDRSDLYITLLQAPLIVFAFFFVFQNIVNVRENPVAASTPLRNYLTGDTVSLVIFLVVLSAIWFGTSKAIIELPSQKALFNQEKLSFLRKTDYIIATFIALSLIVFFQVFLFSVFFHALFYSIPAYINPFETGLILKEDEIQSVNISSILNVTLFIKLLLLMWLIAVASISVAILLSIFLPTRAAANAILPFVLILQILMGGSIIKSVVEMRPSVKFVSNFMVSRWGFEAAILLFEKELYYNMPRYQKEHSGKESFMNGSFISVGALPLKAIKSREYIECVKKSMMLQFNTADSYDRKVCKNYNLQNLVYGVKLKNYKIPHITSVSTKVFYLWSKALERALSDKEFDGQGLDEKMVLVKVELEKYIKEVEKSGDYNTLPPKIIITTALEPDLLNEVVKKFEIKFINNFNEILITSEYVLMKEQKRDWEILTSAMVVDPSLKLFRANNALSVHLALVFIITLSLILARFFLERIK